MSVDCLCFQLKINLNAHLDPQIKYSNSKGQKRSSAVNDDECLDLEIGYNADA